MARPQADLEYENELLAEHSLLAGMDEVGRGALAGPVSVGVVVVTRACGPVPPGLTDSKLLSPRSRAMLVPQVSQWCEVSAVGHASALEIDEIGIIAALRRAGRRALYTVEAEVGPIPVVLLDGKHDWLTNPPADLFADDFPAAELPTGLPASTNAPRVVTRVKADVTCASVAAASVLAKCERDALMAVLSQANPGYGWDSNKGYGSSAHLRAVIELGTTHQHRRTWKLPV